MLSLWMLLLFSSENSQLHQQKERLIHDHELVCRENERLLKKLAAAGQNADNTRRPSIDHQSTVSSRLSENHTGIKDNFSERQKGNEVRIVFDNEPLPLTKNHDDSIGMAVLQMYFNVHVCGSCLMLNTFLFITFFFSVNRSEAQLWVERNLSSCTHSHN